MRRLVRPMFELVETHQRESLCGTYDPRSVQAQSDSWGSARHTSAACRGKGCSQPSMADATSGAWGTGGNERDVPRSLPEAP
jgi:hypothetical protein